MACIVFGHGASEIANLPPNMNGKLGVNLLDLATRQEIKCVCVRVRACARAWCVVCGVCVCVCVRVRVCVGIKGYVFIVFSICQGLQWLWRPMWCSCVRDVCLEGLCAGKASVYLSKRINSSLLTKIFNSWHWLGRMWDTESDNRWTTAFHSAVGH